MGCVFTVREDLHVTARTKKFPSRGGHSSYCRVDNQHWLAEPVSVDGSHRARLSLGAATSVEREGRDVGRSGARGDALDRFFRSKTGADTRTTTGQRSQAPSTSVRRRPLGSGCVAREEHWRRSGLVRKVPADMEAKLREMLT